MIFIKKWIPRSRQWPRRGMTIFLLLLVFSCSNRHNNGNVPDIDVNKGKAYFLTTDNKNASLYSLDLTTQTAVPLPAAANLNGDVSGYQSRDDNNNLQSLYLAENITDQPARVTVYNAAGNVNQNTTDLPQNISDMLLVNNSLYFTGYDKKEIAVAEPFLNSVPLPKRIVSGFEKDPKYSPNNFSAILNQDNNFYVLTVGFTPPVVVGATIYQLKSDPVSGYPVAGWTQSWPIKSLNNRGNLLTCWNVASTVRVNNRTLIVSCNPSWEIPSPPEPPAVFLVEMSSAGPKITWLTSAVDSQAINDELTLAGLSKDKSSILITEDNGDYSNPTMEKSYWLNIQNQKQTDTNGAFSVTYDSATDSYLFSCILNEAKQCQANAFAVAKAATLDEQVNAVALTNVANLYGVRGIKFFKDL